MIRLSLRDLQWRRRRFAIVVLVASLAFGLAVTVSGVTRQLRSEGSDAVAFFGADEWVIPDGATGPFTSSQLLDRAASVAAVERAGAPTASPVLVGHTTLDGRDVNVVGYDPAGPMVPERLAAARESTDQPDGVIADVTLGRQVGDDLAVGGRDLPVVAEVSRSAFLFSAPTVFLPLDVVQDLLFAGRDVTSAVMVQGSVDPAAVAAEDGALTVVTDTEVLADFERVIEATSGTIGIITALLWLMAAGIVAAIVYLTALERTRDLATLKAMGTSNRSLVAGLVLQAAAISVAAGAVSIGVSRLLVPAFDFPVSIPTAAYVQLAVLSLVIGIVASLVAVRRVVRIDPVLAFGATS